MSLHIVHCLYPSTSSILITCFFWLCLGACSLCSALIQGISPVFFFCLGYALCFICFNCIFFLVCSFTMKRTYSQVLAFAATESTSFLTCRKYMHNTIEILQQKHAENQSLKSHKIQNITRTCIISCRITIVNASLV